MVNMWPCIANLYEEKTRGLLNSFTAWAIGFDDDRPNTVR
jgi:hypothetical protein